MKQKLFLFTAFFALYLLPVEAKKVSPQKAEIVASKLTTTTSNTLRNSPLKLTLVHTQVENKIGTRSTGNTANEATYYVFNKGDNNGFIIVSADDVANPILGYTNTGNYDASNLPVNFAGWTESLSHQIAYAIDNNLKQDSETKGLWDSYLLGTMTPSAKIGAIEPLLKTTWSQSRPFNDLTPSRSVTGCVATAMAQIMKYHNYPTRRTVTIPGYTTTTNRYIISPIGPSSYAWSYMINDYIYPSYSQANKTAVAKLMYDCGVSINMNYTPSGSGAPSYGVVQALVNYFGYDKGIQFKTHSNDDKKEWENTLYAEIKANRPVYYAGYESGGSGGHAFVCDGYDNFGFFHFNWGWSGSYNGYFATTALNPNAESGQGTYNLRQEIIINIKPNQGGESELQLTLDKASDLKIKKTTLDKGENFVLEGLIRNQSQSDFSGECGIALVDANDNILNIVGQSTNSIKPQSGVSTKYINCTIPQSIAGGNYFLGVVFKEVGASTWTLLEGGIDYVSKIPITINNGQLNISRLVFLESRSFSVSKSRLAIGEWFFMNAYISNTTQSRLSGYYGIALVDAIDNIIAVVGQQSFILSSGLYKNLSYIDPRIPTDIALGNYFLRVITKETGQSDWAFVTGTPSYADRVPITIVNNMRSMNLDATIDANLSALKIYTSQGTIHATLNDGSSIKEVLVYNLSGVMVYSTQVNSASFASNYTFIPGAYIVKIKTDTGIETKKILLK